MRFRTTRRKTPTINIVAMIDILCILLIFFVVTTVFKRQEPQVKIELPDSTRAKPASAQVPTLVYVTAKNEVFLDSQPVELKELTTRVRERRAADPQFQLAMKADKAAGFGTIVKVMDAVKEAGMDNLPTFMDQAEGAAGSTP